MSRISDRSLDRQQSVDESQLTVVQTGQRYSLCRTASSCKTMF